MARKVIQKDEDERWLETRNIIVAFLVIFFIVGIILAYYNLLYTEKRNNIIKNGETTAMKSADGFNRYLSTSGDVVELTAYTLENMLREGRTHQEMLDYMVGQTTAVKNTILERSEGLYGYIDGEFLSGTLWEPGSDYVATERPWYVNTVQSTNKLTMTKPYIDAKSGKVMMTLSVMLEDKKSVVAMDLALDEIQKITEEAVMSDDSDIEMIIDDDYTVIAHSDINEIGKDHSPDSDSLTATMISELQRSDKDFFEFEYGEDQYMVYSVKLDNDWRCLSVRNATRILKGLNMILGSTIAIVMIMVITLAAVFRKSNLRSVIAERLNKQLSSTAEIYRSVRDVDVINDTFSEIQTNSSKVTDILDNTYPDAGQTLIRILDEITAVSSMDEVHRFMDLGTLDERLSDRKTIAVEFLNNENHWLRGRFVVSQRTLDGKLSHVLFMVEDIDKEKKERDALIVESERAIAANEAKSSFLSNMSHEIRTPINAVLGMNEMILRESSEQNIVSYSESIRTAGQTLLGIVNDILDFSKIEAGKMDIIPVDYDLSSVLSDLVNMIQTRVDEKGLVLNLEFDRETPKFLKGDEVRIKQIITNILTNAVKYTEKGNILFKLSYEKIDDDPDSIMLNVSVKDTGVGIKPEDMEKLFSEFERIDTKRNRKIEGTGLGMTITKRMLEMMGSSLKVESVYGVGSRFGFSLRQQVIKWDELGDYETSYLEHLKKQSANAERFTAPDASVLIVDDNPVNIIVFMSLLKRTKVKIDQAKSGDEALAITASKKFDMIFLDHMMPDKDGIETLHEMRMRQDDPNSDTPVICLTANAISGAREQYIAEGFDDYLTKPVDSDRLEEMMALYLPEDKMIEGGGSVIRDDDNESEIPDLVKNIDEIDVETGIRNNGSVRTYIDTMCLFAKTAESNADEIERFISEDDIENATIKIHSLKSTSKIIGALDIAELAQKLENAGKASDIATLKNGVGSLLSRCRDLGRKLSGLLKTKEIRVDDLEPISDEMLKEAFGKIKDYAQDYDNSGVGEVLDELMKYRLPESEENRLKELLAASDEFDFERICSILEER
ncbi:MAG: response regulator [Lachnospiraceae bacterium]|nr:response regulator [Lachnospiraceae bacterium]